VSAPPPPEALAEILRAAGAIVRKAFDAPMSVDMKADGSPVTATDREVDAFLRDALASLVPDAAWLSEESADDRARLERDAVWIVDPIDGTKQFVRRIPELAISIALVRGGRPVAAAVLNPIADHEGVWVEGTPPSFRGLVARPAPPSLESAEAIVSRSETEDGGLAGFEALVGSTRSVGSVAYKLLRVAAGADALTYSLRPKSEWDVCGGVGLLRAAGRVFLRLDDAPVVFNRPDPRIPSGAVAGPRALAEAARRELVRRLGGAVRAS
jgi:myo-inositol-1(or 4)-monophosphatase